MNYMKYLVLPGFFIVCNFALVHADSGESANTESPYSLGGTFDSVSKYHAQLPSCFKEDFIHLDIGSNQEASLQFKQNQSRQSQHKITTIEVTEDVLWGLWSNTYTYTKSTRSDNYTLTVGFTSDYTVSARLKDYAIKNVEDTLVPEAGMVYDKFKTIPSEENYKEFRQLCGDKLITGAYAGVRLDFTLVFNFDSVTEKDVALEINGIDSFSKVITMVQKDIKEKQKALKGKLDGVVDGMRDTNTKYSLTAVAIQLGGNPNELGNVFGKYGTYKQNGNIFSITCGKGLDCTKLINDVVSYSSKLDSQIKNAHGDYDYKKLYFYSPTNTIDYSFYNNKLFTTEFAKSITADIYKRKVGEQYFRDEKADIYTSRYLTYLQSIQSVVQDAAASAGLKKLINKLKNIANEYKNVMALYKNPKLKIIDCYTNVTQNSCQSIYNNLITSRNEKIDEQSASLVNHLMNSQYLGDFYFGDSETEYMSCNIMPISNSIDGFFLADCPKEEDFSAKFIMKIKRFGNKLEISPFSYTIGGNDFNYSDYFAGNLNNGIVNPDVADYFTDYLYEGTMNVSIHNYIELNGERRKPINLYKDEFNLLKLLE